MPQYTNQQLAEVLQEIGRLLEIKETSFRVRAYKKAVSIIKNEKEELSLLYQQKGIAGLKAIKGIGQSMAEKLEEYLKTGKIKYLEELRKETAIRQVITHFFESKGVDISELKKNAKKRKIVYSRYTKPAKQLIELAGSVNLAKGAIDKVAKWANSRNLDYAIETVFKKWLEIDRLKPKKIVKKPFYDDKPMYYSEVKRKWYVIEDDGEWKEYADKEDKIDWRTTK